MTDFMVRFFICNLFISGMIWILSFIKQLFGNIMSSRMQYNLWYLLLFLLAVPFLPLCSIQFPQMFLWLGGMMNSSLYNAQTAAGDAVINKLTENFNWMNEFALSVNSEAPPITGFILLVIWSAGSLTMIVKLIKSSLCLHTLKQSALPLQNASVRGLYRQCLSEMGIKKDIPVYSTAFLKSPFIVGLMNPCIYLPIHLISDYKEADIRYMLLHELQHYKSKDALAGYLMNLAGIVYWFNPLVWHALGEMRNDREVACDTSVLKMLESDSYEDYGNTLINFTEKVSLTPFPFTAGLGGSMKQMKKRIISISSYEKPTFRKNLKGIIAFILIAVLLVGFAPFISANAAQTGHYHWKASDQNISYTDLSAYFDEYAGSFVLYDLENDKWNIHNMEHATLRVSPNSTYKIYDALFGLEEGIITPNDSFLAWNGISYPFAEWNTDQTLQSAMRSSVNWYFQALDGRLGDTLINRYVQKIGYGNKNVNSNLSSYWMESSLKISPVEQVELLTKLQTNSFGFAPENINAIKDSICLFSSAQSRFYGKTGTGRVDDKDVNGWFVGYVETAGNTYFFATNIRGSEGAAGSNAAEITMSVLSDLNIWKE